MSLRHRPFRHAAALLAVLLVGLGAPAAGAQDGVPAGLADGAILTRDTIRHQPERRAFFLSLIERRGFAADAAARVLDSVVVQRITYLSGGLRVAGFLVEPPGRGPLPAVIYNRGGNRGFGSLTETTAFAFLAPLAARGYVVVASQYRGGPGSEGADEFGGADVDDVLNLLPLLEGHPRADAARIGMVGASRGGLMTYLALARTDRLRAAVVLGGMSDAFAAVEERPEMETDVMAEMVPNWAAEREAALLARSPVRWADRLYRGTPLLLLHGSADWRVVPTEAMEMATALLAARHPFRLVMYEGSDHSLTEHRAESFGLMTEWLDRYVRDGAPPPNVEPHGD